LLGDPKTWKKIHNIIKKNNTHKVHIPKMQGRAFSEVGEAPQARALGTPSS
jgi:hypothetical protein